MKRIHLPIALLTLFAAGAAIGAAPSCDVDLDKARQGQPEGAELKIQVKRTACVVVEGGDIVVSNTSALRPEVTEWKELAGGAREARAVTLTRQQPGAFQVYVKRSGMTTAFILTD